MKMTSIKHKVTNNILVDVLDLNVEQQFRDCLDMDGCVQGFLAPDTHLGYVAPIGSVFKFKNRISPALVGYDIGCGVISAELNIKAEDLDLDKLKNSILRSVPIGFNRHNENQEFKFDKSTASDMLIKAMNEVGYKQRATLGGGNHFVELGTSSKTGNLHIIIHSGSRGFGHKVATHYMKEAAIQSIDELEFHEEFRDKNTKWITHLSEITDKKIFIKEQEKFVDALKKYTKNKLKSALGANFEGNYSLDLDTDVGKQYLIDQNIALHYALMNRKGMVDAIIKDINNQLEVPVEIVEVINRNHNHAELQIIEHSNGDGSFTDEKYIIHRKGATHAEKGMLGVIPGNMKDGCFIVKGLGNADSMQSSSHGAGRVLSRKRAKAELDIDAFHNQMEGIVTNHTDGTLDEAPGAYKNIFEVMQAQEDLVEIQAHVIPVLNIKG
ncbi:MAG: RtcB family protein [Clostridiales bacterium]|nr:RtcB family protein [Clostridiales bacterium]